MKVRRLPSLALTLAFSACLLCTPHPSIAAATKTKPAPAATAKPGKVPAAPADIAGPIDTLARHALIVEADTGAVLLDKGAAERIPPASMSKVMTAYMVFDYLKKGRAKLDDELPVSERAWRTGGSKMFVPIGGRIKIADLVRGMVIQSGNDACIVLAEGLAGSETAFVDQMNQKAKEIGLNDSHFANVDGLPNPDHWMTAHDLAVLALHTIRDFPEYYKIYSEKEFGYNNINQGNRNPLLYKDLGADGLKTGHTEEAGYSLLASVKRSNRRIVLVLNGLPSMKARAQESERLVEWAFREYNNYQLFSGGTKVDDADVWLGTQTKVPLTIANDLVVTLPRKARKDMKVTVSFDQPIAAPIEKGQALGKVIVTAPDMKPIERPLQAANDVERLGAFGRMAMVAGSMIWGGRR